MAKQPQSQSRKSYRYTGPVTPLDIEGQKTRMLFPGASYTELPEDHPIVSNLIERELLIAEIPSAEVVGGPLSEGA